MFEPLYYSFLPHTFFPIYKPKTSEYCQKTTFLGFFEVLSFCNHVPRNEVGRFDILGHKTVHVFFFQNALLTSHNDELEKRVKVGNCF